MTHTHKWRSSSIFTALHSTCRAAIYTPLYTIDIKRILNTIQATRALWESHVNQHNALQVFASIVASILYFVFSISNADADP